MLHLMLRLTLDQYEPCARLPQFLLSCLLDRRLLPLRQVMLVLLGLRLQACPLCQPFQWLTLQRPCRRPSGKCF